MELLIVTGMSGAGKTKCLKFLEDIGYLCIDNLIPKLLPDVVGTYEREREICAVARLAVSVDARGGVFFNGIYDAIDELERQGYRPRVLFLDATDEALCARYKETRREHPLSMGGRVEQGIRAERELLTRLRERADFYVDTSDLATVEYRQKIYDLLPEYKSDNPAVILISFGLKRGIPFDCDMVYDVRYLPNPFHVEELRPLNGTQQEIMNYVFSDPIAEESVRGMAEYIERILPAYLANVKSNLVVGIGCTGGKHRSVACTERLAEILRDEGLRVSAEHRDLYKE